jgi:hypothetical protein
MVAEQDEDLRVDALEVSVDHPLHLIETTRVPLSRSVKLESGQDVYEVRVRFVSAAVIHGRLVRENGAPAAEGLVGPLLLEEDFPIEAEGRAVDCAADGSFELRVPASGRYALASYEYGRRPTTTRVDVLVGSRLDVGTLVLEPGNTISGQVLCRGNPVADASVGAVLPSHRTAATPEAVKSGMQSSVYEGRSFATRTRSIQLLWMNPSTDFSTVHGEGSRRGGRFELSLRRRWEATDENGAFAFRGLSAGEYLVSLEGMAESRTAPGNLDKRPEGMISQDGGTPGRVYRAPERGLVLEYHWTSIRFELAGDLESEDEGRLLLRTPSARPTSSLPPEERGSNVVFDFQTSVTPLSGNERTLVLAALPSKHMTGEVVFPGRQPVTLDFWTPESCEEVVVPIELVPAEETTTLVIKVENRHAELPETFTVKLRRAESSPEDREVKIADGRLRLENLLPGQYQVRVRPGANRYYQSGLYFDTKFDVELHAGLEAKRPVRILRRGGSAFEPRDWHGPHGCFGRIDQQLVVRRLPGPHLARRAEARQLPAPAPLEGLRGTERDGRDPRRRVHRRRRHFVQVERKGSTIA